MRYVLVMNRNIPPDFRYNTLKKAKRTYYTPFLNLVTKKTRYTKFIHIMLVITINL